MTKYREYKNILSKIEDEISKPSSEEQEQEKELAKKIFKMLDEYGLSIEGIFNILDQVKIIVLDKLKIQQQYEKKDESRRGGRNNDKIL